MSPDPQGLDALFTAAPSTTDRFARSQRLGWREDGVRHVQLVAEALGLPELDLAARMASWDVSRPWTPEVGWRLHRLQLAVEDNDLDGAVDCVAALGQLASPVASEDLRIRSLYDAGWDRDWAATARANAARRGLSMTLRPLQGEALATYRGWVAEALQRFASVDPELFDEFRSTAVEILLFRGNFCSSQNIATAPGAIAFGFGPTDPDVDGFLLGQLAHEAGHLHLCAIMEVDPLFHNDDTPRYRLAARPDPRPMAAVMHAAFVYARQVRVLRRAAVLEPDNGSFPRALATIEPAFDKVYRLLRTHAELTPHGRRLADSLPQVAAA